jgi:4-carboxymuconolactone decarboxylase
MEDSMIDRMPALAESQMQEAQRKAAAGLTAGPRKGVFGPFIPLLRSPELMDRLQRVGEYLRFGSSVPGKLNEFAVCITARHWTNQFEWAVHYPLAIGAGVSKETLDAVSQGRDPAAMPDDEALVHDFLGELLQNHGVSDATYSRAVDMLGEQGVIDLVGLAGYFSAICMVMNVARTPAPRTDVLPLAHMPP